MGFVYKYIDKEDNIVKYVGITKDLDARIKSHKLDDWVKKSDYKIQYIELNIRADCEYLEGCFISYYKTYNYYNKAKKEWGEGELFDPTKYIWMDYVSEKDKKLNELNDTRRRINSIQNLINEKVYELEELEIKKSDLQKKIEEVKQYNDILNCGIEKYYLFEKFPFNVNDIILFYKIFPYDYETKFNSVLTDYNGKIAVNYTISNTDKGVILFNNKENKQLGYLNTHNSNVCSNVFIPNDIQAYVYANIGIHYFPYDKNVYYKLFDFLLKQYSLKFNNTISLEDVKNLLNKYNVGIGS